MHRQINGVPLEEPNAIDHRLVQCNCNSFRKQQQNRHKRARNRFCLDLAKEHNRIDSLSFEINMNYEKWPFNLAFSQYDHRCILFHFQLWFGIVVDCFQFFRCHSLHTFIVNHAIVNWSSQSVSLTSNMLWSANGARCTTSTKHITFRMCTYRCQSNDFNYGAEFVLAMQCGWARLDLTRLGSFAIQLNNLSNRIGFWYEL